LRIERLMCGTQRKGVGNNEGTEFAKHDSQGKLGLHATEQTGRRPCQRGDLACSEATGTTHPVQGVLEQRRIAAIVLWCCDQQALVAGEQSLKRFRVVRESMFGFPIRVINREFEI
jgi:hypothetical protein